MARKQQICHMQVVQLPEILLVVLRFTGPNIRCLWGTVGMDTFSTSFSISFVCVCAFVYVRFHYCMLCYVTSEYVRVYCFCVHGQNHSSVRGRARARASERANERERGIEEMMWAFHVPISNLYVP